MNLAQLVVRAGQAHAARPAIALGARIHASYGELARRVAVLAGHLHRQYGLQRGARVAIVMPNAPAYLEILYACWHAGLIAVPINAKLAAAECAYILHHSGARLGFVSAEWHAALAPLQRELPALQRLIAADSAGYAQLLHGEPLPLADCAPTDTAWLFYTSGTTGRPKGAMLSQRNLYTLLGGYFTDVDSIHLEDSIIHAAPLSHGSGLYSLPHVAAAAVQVIPESGRFEPDEFFELVAAYRGVSAFLAPTMIHRLLHSPAAAWADTVNLKTIIYGGGPMYVEDCKRALARFGQKFVQIYGQGESPMTITTLSRAAHAETQQPHYEQRLASVGLPQALVEVRVADAEDQPLPVGEIGEVLVRGDSVMTGYWQDAEATAKTLRNGWLHTGDLGSFDSEGFLTLKDRCKDLIISGGSNIYPREIEEVLLRHPAVLEAAVIGRPDPEWGEAVVAFVVVKPHQELNAQALDELCLQHIARYKRPREYRLLAALPRNHYGKVLKTELRQLL